MKLYYENEDLKPFKKYQSDAGWDLISKEKIVILPGQTQKIPTGVSCEIPEGWVGIVKIRSGFSLKGLDVTAGVIDSDYRGEIHVVVQNHANENVEIQKKERFCQLLILKCLLDSQLIEGKADQNTQRASNGFGSTGK